ncbi:MAG: hypothetical protein JKY32_07745 [Rhizobiales bacterium]|nr:hypothetical protein [Hyphomicrobiales bacterium]
MSKTTLIPYGRRLMLPAHMATDIIALAILKKIRAGECYTQTDLLQLGFTPEIIDALYEDACKEAGVAEVFVSDVQAPPAATSPHPDPAGGRKGPGDDLPYPHRPCCGDL